MYKYIYDKKDNYYKAEIKVFIKIEINILMFIILYLL